MRFSILLATAFAATALHAWAGTPKQAAGIREAYDRDFQLWVLKLKVAQTSEERSKVAADRPDVGPPAREMWAAIQPNLAEEWTLEPAAWLLRVTAGQQVKDAAGKPLVTTAFPAIRRAIEARHMSSKNLTPFCMAAVAADDPNALPLLEKIERDSPDKKTQGVAALGAAMLLKNLSDEPEVMRRRLTLLRKAIIESSEIEINGVSVAKMAEDELYIIQFLSKGRVAPDLEGVGSSGQPMKLSEYTGKVVVLLFWRFEEDTNGQLVEMVRLMKERFAGKPFEVVGVNRDAQAQLRDLQTTRGIQWPNFSDPDNKLGAQYRVASWPLAYVIDGSRKIAYVGGVSSFVELTAAALLEEKK